MDQFVGLSGGFFFGADEKLARRKRNAIGERRVKRFRASAYYLGRVGHSGDDPFDRFDRIVLVRLDLRQLVEHRLRQFALFEVEHAIISQKESAAILLVGLLGVEVFAAPLRVFDLPKNHDRAFLAFADVSAKFVAWRYVNQNGETYFDAESRK